MRGINEVTSIYTCLWALHVVSCINPFLCRSLWSFLEVFKNKMAHPTTPHPLSHNLHQHLAQPLPFPICMSSNLLSAYPIISTAQRRIFAASSTKFGLSFVYNPNVMLEISIGSASLAPFSPDQRKRGLRHWSRPHPHSWVIFLPSLRSWKPRSGRQTDEERHPQSCTPYNMAPVQHPSMLLSFSKSCAMSYRT